MPEFELYLRDTFSRNFVFEESYFPLDGWTLSPQNPNFPSDIYRFLNLSPGQSASFFLFHNGVKPIYDDPEHHNGGGEFSFYYHMKNELLLLDTAMHEMIHGLIHGSILAADKQTPNLPFGDITGMSIIPKKDSVSIKLWISKNSLLRGKSPTEVFGAQYFDSWKLADAKYLSFDRPAAPAVVAAKHATRSTPSARQPTSYHTKDRYAKS